MALLTRMANLFRRSRVEREIEAELRSHIQMRIEDNRAAGMTMREARRDARMRFGNPAAMKERTAEMDVAGWMESAAADVRFAMRQLGRSPGFAVTAVVVLAMGIGACTAIFSAVKPILLDALPLPHPERLVMLWEKAKSGTPNADTFCTFVGLSESSHAYEALAVMKAWQPAIVAGQEGGRPERLEGQRVSAGYFRAMGVTPRLGRDFEAADDAFRGPRCGGDQRRDSGIGALLRTQRLWASRCGWTTVSTR